MVRGTTSRGHASRLCIQRASLFALVALLGVVCSSLAPAQAAKTASVVVDANTGRALHDTDGDARRYPASLTKMMTLYIVFEELAARRLTAATPMTASARAEGQPPSKIGIAAGEQISVRDAIDALVVKSANDVATVVAEHIAGSEWAFARRMTETARRIGMTATTFRNASGLPDRAQVTTAHDMVRLGLALQDHFPQYYPAFQRTTFSFRGKRFRSHNAIVRSFPGADGLKTGYIRASGFNIVSTVRRGGKRVVAAVFGGSSAGARDRKTKLLLTRALGQASRKVTRSPIPRGTAPDARPLLVARPREIRRSDTGGRVAARTLPPGWSVSPRGRGAQDGERWASAHANKPEPIGRPKLVRRGNVSITEGARPQTIGDLVRQTALGNDQGADAGRRHTGRGQDDGSGANHPRLRGAVIAPHVPRRAVGPYQIQVGAYGTQPEAERQLSRVAEAAGGIVATLARLTPTVTAAGRTLYRARFAGLDQKLAAETCNDLRAQGIDCHVTR